MLNIFVAVFLGFVFYHLSFRTVSDETKGKKTPPEIFYFDTLAEKITLEKNQVIVDVGCGDGGLVKWFKETKHFTNFFGIDLDHVVKKTARELPDLSDSFRVGIGESIPFEDSSVDVVLFQRTFHHVEDYSKAINEISRVLKPGGDVIFLEPITILGRYEIYELVKFFVYEEDEKASAYEIIKNGAKEHGLNFDPWEKHVVITLNPVMFQKYLAKNPPDNYETSEREIDEYINRIASEDEKKPEDLEFFSTSRINLWKKI